MPPKKCLSSTFPVIASHVVTWCVDWRTGNPSVCQWSVKWDVYHTATFGMFMLVFAKCSKTAEKLDVSVWFSEPAVWLSWSLFFCCLVTKSCPTFCDPMDCSLPGFSVHGDSPGKNTGVGCHFLLQGIFLTQGSNLHLLCLLLCRWILYRWDTREAPSTSLQGVGNLWQTQLQPCRIDLNTLGKWAWYMMFR